MKPVLWRELVVKGVSSGKNSINVSFCDSNVGFTMNKAHLTRRGVSWREIVPGRSILIKGREGNDDVALWRMDALEGIVLVPSTAKK